MLLHLLFIHRTQAGIKLFKLLSRDPRKRLSVFLVPKQIQDVLTDPDQMLDLPLL